MKRGRIRSGRQESRNGVPQTAAVAVREWPLLPSCLPKRPALARSRFDVGSAPSRGQAVTEYVLVLAFALVFVFAPVPVEVMKNPDGQYMSLFMLFIHTFEIYINSYHTVITLPVP